MSFSNLTSRQSGRLEAMTATTDIARGRPASDQAYLRFLEQTKKTIDKPELWHTIRRFTTAQI